jgi:hypothetical protein
MYFEVAFIVNVHHIKLHVVLYVNFYDSRNNIIAHNKTTTSVCYIMLLHAVLKYMYLCSTLIYYLTPAWIFERRNGKYFSSHWLFKVMFEKLRLVSKWFAHQTQKPKIFYDISVIEHEPSNLYINMYTFKFKDYCIHM